MMKSEHIQRFKAFMDLLSKDIYSEEDTVSEENNMHKGMTKEMIDTFEKKYHIPPFIRILDVGCGQGFALDIFKEKGYRATGVTLGKKDYEVCLRKGLDVHMMDQSFLDFEDNSFEIVWSRHCLEHSFMPLFTIHEYKRVLTRGGFLYIEVPQSETIFNHENNPNHYSLFTEVVWHSLFRKAGFSSVDQFKMVLYIPNEERTDEYLVFVLRK